ncbi:MAG: alpha/beta fold hydrolase [Myxococcales bacterium]|nr:alpha/beta fold hydrolase [Myxococcales bacterium]
MARPAQPSPATPQRQLTQAGVATFTDEGAGPVTFVCVHGLPGSVRDFRWLAPVLAQGARVIRLELPGFGACPAGQVAPTITAFAAYVAEVITALELERVALVGHSFGAMVAAAAVHRLGGRPARVALINPIGLTPHPGFEAVRQPRLLRAAHEHRVVGRAVRPLVRRMFEGAGFKGFTPDHIARALAVLAHMQFEGHRGLVTSLPGPVLVAWADDDPVVPPRITAELLGALPAGPRLHFRAGGHNLQKHEALAVGRALLSWAAA